MFIQGLAASQSVLVTPALTADAAGNDGVDVFATPHLLFLLENTCVKAISAQLATEQVTVGVHLDVSHLAPSPVGVVVQAHVQLVQADDRRLLFEVSAEDGIEQIAKGTHTRVVMDRSEFAARCERKAASVQAAQDNLTKCGTV